MDTDKIISEKLAEAETFFKQELDKALHVTVIDIITTMFHNPNFGVPPYINPESVSHYPTQNFAGRSFGPRGITNIPEMGAGYMKIKKLIESKFSEEANTAKVELFISQHWNRLLEEATIQALKHKAEVAAFTTVRETEMP